MMNFILAIALLLSLSSSAFADCLLLPIIGDGTEKNEYRPDIPPALSTAKWTAHIPSMSPTDGKPRFGDSYVCFADSLKLPVGVSTITRTQAEAEILKREPKLDRPKPLPEPRPKASGVVDRIRRFSQKYFAITKAHAGSGSDAFGGRGPNVDLGSSWDPYEQTPGSGTFPCQIGNDDAVYNTTDTQRCIEGYNAYIPTAAQYSKVTLLYYNDNNGADAGAIVRLAAPTTFSGYLCRANNVGSGATAAQLQRRIAGSNSTLASDGGITWTNNDEIKCEANGTGLTFYQNNVSILTASDGNHTSGRGGLFVTNTANIATDGFGVDNFEVGDLGGSSRRPIAPIIFR